ncbi:glycosyltransferase family 2 protein, partial [Streptosporangium minutum]
MNSSIVICVYTEERWEDIQAAVESVENQRRRPYEIILVVDHNPDLHLRLKQRYPGAIVVENTHERGLSGGKNTGAATASGDIVAYLDDDAVAEPGLGGADVHQRLDLEALAVEVERFQVPGPEGVVAVA